MKRRIGPLTKLDCFCTQKRFNVFAFSQAQTSLRELPIRALHLLLAYDLHGLPHPERLNFIDPVAIILTFLAVLFLHNWNDHANWVEVNATMIDGVFSH